MRGGRGAAGGLAATLVAVAALLAFAPGAPAVPRSFYGVVPQHELERADIERMATGRVGTVRVILRWGEIDPTPLPADLDWAELDAVVAAAARERIRVLPVAYSVPRWLSALEGCREASPGSCSFTPPRSEFGLAAWSAFLEAAVQRYGPGGRFWAQRPELPPQPIRVWQVWNEPNSPGFFAPRPDVEGYATLLTAAAEAISAADPNATVLLGGLSRFPLRGVDGGIRASHYLERLLAIPGVAELVDGLALHPYAARMSGVKNQVRRLRAVAAAAGAADLGLWITEVGWASGGERNPLNRGRRGQARRLSQAFRWFTDKRHRFAVRLVAWYAWRDIDHGKMRCGWCARAGLFTADELDPKPAWDRFTAFTGGS